jgi:hypothetical protein
MKTIIAWFWLMARATALLLGGEGEFGLWPSPSLTAAKDADGTMLVTVQYKCGIRSGSVQ